MDASTSDNYRIQKLDIAEDLPDDFFIIVAGKSRSGKGVWSARFLEKMIRAKRLNAKNAYLISSSADVQKDSFPLVKNNRFTEFNDQQILDIIDNNAELIKEDMKKGMTKKQAVKNRAILFIIDDLSYGPVHRSKALSVIATAGRHRGVSCILLTQGLASAVKPMVRKNASAIIAYPSISQKVMRLLIEEYGLMSLGNMSFREARAFLMSIWQNKSYTALCILQHKTDVRKFTDMIRFDRVIHDPDKTTKFLERHQLDIQKKKEPEESSEPSIFRRKK